MVSEESNVSHSGFDIRKTLHIDPSAFFVGSLLISIIGPYVAGNLRIDHLVLLASCGVSAIVFGSRRTKYSTVWMALMVAAILGAIIPVINDLIWPPAYRVTSYIGVVWRLVAPVLLLFVFGVLVNKNNKLYDWIVKKIWILGLINACIALMTIVYVPSWIKFYTTGGGGESVWESALNVGRFTGVFGQPLECGVFYSLILFNLVYLWCDSRIRSWQFVISTFVCLVGGGLSLSKNFLVLGILLAVILAISLNFRKGMNFLLGIFSIIVIAIINLSFWVDASMVSAYTDLVDKGNVLMALTAGRFGSEQTDVMLLFKSVVKENLFNGKGLGTVLPLDNGYLEYFYQGGIGALISFLLIHGLLMVGAWRFRSTKAGITLFFLAIYSLLASLGGPVITANRANILFFFLSAYYLNEAYTEKYGAILYWKARVYPESVDMPGN